MPLKTPARGRFCQHLNVFSLENWLIMIHKNTLRQWHCPICKKKCYDIIIDSYLQEIILKSQKEEGNLHEIIFLPDASYTFEKEESTDEEEDSE